ncbi:MAG: chromate transporter [Candidatus Heteroscillospira sp.]
MIYFKLFAAFLYIGLFTIGGGYASLPLIEEQIVSLNGWLSPSEFTDLITISQITPGPIAINAATFVGTKIAGFPGALCATFGFIVPPFIVVTIFFYIYKKYRQMDLMKGIMGGLRPAVVALIAAAGLSILITAFWGEGAAITLGNLNLLSVVLTVLALVALTRFKIDQIIVIFGCGLIYMAAEFIKTHI